MSRASDLRDAIAGYLASVFLEDPPVYCFYVFNLSREDFTDGPKIVVRIGGREVSIGQAFDPTSVRISVGVAGIAPAQSDIAEGDDFGVAELEKFDEYDGILESLLGLWMRDGNLRRGYEEHFPIAIDPFMQVDAELLSSKGIYLSMFTVTYRDSVD